MANTRSAKKMVRKIERRTEINRTRRSRMRLGALAWSLHEDLEVPGRYVEEIVDESWTEHLRRFDRVSGADLLLRERRFAFHLDDTPPKVQRYRAAPGLDT